MASSSPSRERKKERKKEKKKERKKEIKRERKKKCGEEKLSVTNGLPDCDSGLCVKLKDLFLFLNIFSFPFCVRITGRQPDESNVGVELRKTPLGETGLAHLKNSTRTKK